MLPTEGPRFRDTRGRTRVLFDTTLETRASPSAPRGFGASQSVRPVGVEATEENLDSCVQTRRGSRADPGSVSRRDNNASLAVTLVAAPCRPRHHPPASVLSHRRCAFTAHRVYPLDVSAVAPAGVASSPQRAPRPHQPPGADRERVGITRESTDGRGCRVGERRASGRGGRRRHRRGHRRALVRGAPREVRPLRRRRRGALRRGRSRARVCPRRLPFRRRPVVLPRALLAARGEHQRRAAGAGRGGRDLTRRRRDIQLAQDVLSRGRVRMRR